MAGEDDECRSDSSWTSTDDRLLEQCMINMQDEVSDDEQDKITIHHLTTSHDHESDELLEYRRKLNRIIGTPAFSKKLSNNEHEKTESDSEDNIANILRDHIENLVTEPIIPITDPINQEEDQKEEDTTESNTAETTASYPSLREWLQENAKIRELNDTLDNLDALERFVEMKERLFLKRVVEHTSPELARILSKK
jgi:hypothetical protein